MNRNPPPHFPAGWPPAPRDHAGASFSEIIPVGSSKINLAKSPATLLLILAAIIAPLTVVFSGSLEGPGLRQAFLTFAFVTVFFVTFALGLIVYLYARPARSLLSYLWAYAMIAGMLALYLIGIPFLFDLLSFLFSDLIVGQSAQPGPNVGLGWAFTSHFFAAGLTEELFKATPIFIGLAVGAVAARKPEVAVGPFQRFFRIRGPLDGVIMGAFAGAAFILLETAGLYLPETLETVTAAVRRALADNPEAQALGEQVGISQALILYFPRVIGGAVGHMAYSAIFGYFIGLVLLRPRLGLLLILGGWILAAALHGLWNGIGVVLQEDSSAYYLLIPAALSAICFAAILLKARQLHAFTYGEAPETMGSIVIDRSRSAPLQPPTTPPHGSVPPPPYGFAPPSYGFAPPPQPMPAYPPVPAAFDPPAAPAPTTSHGELSFDLDGLMISIRAGAVIDPATEPALGGRGAGARGKVVEHPSRLGVLGLRNAGDTVWTAHLRDGRTQQIGRDQNVRLAVGVGVDFGGGLFGKVIARG